jgi:hypothetical protein
MPLTLKVNPSGSLTITTPSLPAGEVGVAYSQLISATGGTMPYSWSVTSGSLPAGLSLNPLTGVIVGTPTTDGTAVFLVQVTDAASVTATMPYALTVNPSGTLTISTTSLPSAHVGVHYSRTLNATGGTLPRTWSITAGSLPSGLTLNTTTGAITGTPTSTGTSSFTARVTDAATATASMPLSITVGSGSTGGGTGIGGSCGNVGIGNTGCGNIGNYNSGNGNIGDNNSGNGNIGNNNSGDGNVGNNNTGNGNIGNGGGGSGGIWGGLTGIGLFGGFEGLDESIRERTARRWGWFSSLGWW